LNRIEQQVNTWKSTMAKNDGRGISPRGSLAKLHCDATKKQSPRVRGSHSCFPRWLTSSNFQFYELSLNFTTEQFWSASRRYLHNFWLFSFNFVQHWWIFQHLCESPHYNFWHFYQCHATSATSRNLPALMWISSNDRISGNLLKWPWLTMRMMSQD